MRNVLTIAEKELKSYFASPLAYIVMAAFLAVMGFFFYGILVTSQQATMEYTFQNMGVILLLVSPVLAMRLLSEEQRSGTIELLLTSPVRDIEVVIGKFLASLGLMIVMLGWTLYYVLILVKFGNPDAGPIWSGYLGMILTGATFLAIGLLASSLTSNQVVAAFITIASLLILWVVDAVSSSFGTSVGAVLSYISLQQHQNSFPTGVIDTKDVIYFLTIIIACLFLASRSLESRRWR
jgi:ABC-2 type transport system permease protein